MIVVDENLIDPLIVDAIATWYRGPVVSLRRLRPGTIIKDDALPALLNQQSQATFVTNNVTDFWRIARADRRYCIIAFAVSQEQALEIPNLLRRLLRLAEFRTKARRMGKIIRVRPSVVEYYASDRQIHTLTWPDE